MTGDPRRFVDDVKWIRDELAHMDSFADPVMGVADWDDSVCLDFAGRLLASADGPYTKRLVMKSALIHASTDVLAKGGQPLFALDTVIGKKGDVEDMVRSLRRQADALKIPLLGGNTLYEDAEPRCSITVFGKLLTEEPIRDCGAQEGDVVALIGEPIWGEQKERLEKAKTLFCAYTDALDKVKFTSAKDVTKGGLTAAIYEIQQKTDKKIQTENIQYPLTRNLDNLLITLKEHEYTTLQKTCQKHKCKLKRIGRVI